MTNAFIFGLVGGLLRGLVGFIKYQSSYKDLTFKWGYFSLTIGVSGVVGLLAAWVSYDVGINFLGLKEITPAMAFVVGYAGGDFIENVFKIVTGKTNLYLPTSGQ